MLHSKASKFAIFAAVCLLSVGTTRSAHAENYTVTALGPLPGDRGSGAYGINDAGQAVGWSMVGGEVATLWSGGSTIDLGPIPHTGSIADGINNAGQIVGDSYDGGRLFVHATLWSGGSVINLGGLPGVIASTARAINNAGQIVGYSSSNEGPGYATLWSGGSITDLGTLSGGGVSDANGINDAGQVVGMAQTASGLGHATMWSGGSIIDLGTLSGSSGASVAYGINNTGQVAGWSDAAGNVQEATLWSGGSIIDLGRLPGSDGSAAEAINDAGQAVGWSFGSFSDGYGYHATLSDGKKIVDLNSVLDANTRFGWTVEFATGINDVGQIVGYGLYFGQEEAFLLTPCASCLLVPEPSTWAMMLLGFAGLGYAWYRRARAGRATLAALPTTRLSRRTVEWTDAELRHNSRVARVLIHILCKQPGSSSPEVSHCK